MRYTMEPVDCMFDGKKRTFRLIAFHVEPKGRDTRFIEKVLASMDEMKMATHLNPGGRLRSDSELMKTRYLGAASELILLEYLQRRLGELATVSRANFRNYDSHVDLAIQHGDRQLRIEVRGSFPYSPLQRVLCELFDVIGPYATSYKSGETPKDFYLRTLINSRQDQFDHLQNHIIYFAGGADIGMLQQLGEFTDFKQRGASYLAIKPIARARDAIEIVEEMAAFLDNGLSLR